MLAVAGGHRGRTRGPVAPLVAWNLRDCRGSWDSWGPQRTCTPEFRERAVRIVIETGKPVPEVAVELGVHSGTLHSGVSRWRRNGSASSDRPAEPASGGRMRETGRPMPRSMRRATSSGSGRPGTESTASATATTTSNCGRTIIRSRSNSAPSNTETTIFDPYCIVCGRRRPEPAHAPSGPRSGTFGRGPAGSFRLGRAGCRPDARPGTRPAVPRS
ncbi:transposase [Streptomyces atratus]